MVFCDWLNLPFWPVKFFVFFDEKLTKLQHFWLVNELLDFPYLFPLNSQESLNNLKAISNLMEVFFAKLYPLLTFINHE